LAPVIQAAAATRFSSPVVICRAIPTRHPDPAACRKANAPRMVRARQPIAESPHHLATARRRVKAGWRRAAAAGLRMRCALPLPYATGCASGARARSSAMHPIMGAARTIDNRPSHCASQRATRPPDTDTDTGTLVQPPLCGQRRMRVKPG
jgi:hypothetical protein